MAVGEGGDGLIIGIKVGRGTYDNEEIKNTILTLMKTQHLLIEGAAGVALAALLQQAKQFQGKNVVVLLSGGNISLDVLRSVLS